jgi:hypothetical protein
MKYDLSTEDERFAECLAKQLGKDFNFDQSMEPSEPDWYLFFDLTERDFARIKRELFSFPDRYKLFDAEAKGRQLWPSPTGMHLDVVLDIL